VTPEPRFPIQAFGKPGGRQVLYFHGAPGAPVEAELLADAAQMQGAELLAIGRSSIVTRSPDDDYLATLASVVRGLNGGRHLPIIGFSIGAALALRIAARLGGACGPLFLVSAAGPLDAPGAFAGMGTGERVFRLAKANGLAFEAVVCSQALLARRAPNVLRRLLFAGAEPSDRLFAESPDGLALLSPLLRRAWADGGAGYRTDLLAYVQDWSGELAHVAVPVKLWHGRHDNWAPISMAHAIADRLPTACIRVSETGHYSTLVNNAPAVLAAACRVV
jgi:pimeloyl-ACP methyl ester carboxylesterase